MDSARPRPDRYEADLRRTVDRLRTLGLPRLAARFEPEPTRADAARGVALASDGSGGWVLDLFGNLYPFGIGTNPPPPGTVGNPKWSTATARGVASLP